MKTLYKVTSKGRITIPAELRKKFGIKFPCKVFFKEERDGIKMYLKGR